MGVPCTYFIIFVMAHWAILSKNISNYISAVKVKKLKMPKMLYLHTHCSPFSTFLYFFLLNHGMPVSSPHAPSLSFPLALTILNTHPLVLLTVHIPGSSSLWVQVKRKWLVSAKLADQQWSLLCVDLTRYIEM